MRIENIIVTVDIDCEWHGTPPRYRCYVNNELFTERTWIWTEYYLQERIPIQTEPGQYHIHYELVDPENAQLKITNYQVISGPGIVNQQGNLIVQESLNEDA